MLGSLMAESMFTRTMSQLNSDYLDISEMLEEEKTEDVQDKAKQMLKRINKLEDSKNLGEVGDKYADLPSTNHIACSSN